jgi:hypothetical protein
VRPVCCALCKRILDNIRLHSAQHTRPVAAYSEKMVVPSYGTAYCDVTVQLNCPAVCIPNYCTCMSRFRNCCNLQKHGGYCRGADKSSARPASRCILFDGENILFDASVVICINSTNIPPIMIINRIYEPQNCQSL